MVLQLQEPVLPPSQSVMPPSIHACRSYFSAGAGRHVQNVFPVSTHCVKVLRGEEKQQEGEGSSGGGGGAAPQRHSGCEVPRSVGHRND